MMTTVKIGQDKPWRSKYFVILKLWHSATLLSIKVSHL